MADVKPNMTYADFEKLDIRMGTVIDASIPKWSNKLLKYTVDFGETIGKRTIFSGIKKWYTPEDLISKQFAFIINLEPKKMGEEYSQGMMLMADAVSGNPEDAGKPVLFPLASLVENGTVVR